MLLENRSLAVEEKLNGFNENTTWKLWERAMLSRRMMNLAGAGMKSKVVNKLFKDTWVQHRGEIHFAEKSFNKMWKARNKH